MAYWRSSSLGISNIGTPVEPRIPSSKIWFRKLG
jgi:hypothetical protein